jgi:hypothetical protein
MWGEYLQKSGSSQELKQATLHTNNKEKALLFRVEKESAPERAVFHF